MLIVLLANTSWYLYNFRKKLILSLLENGHEVFVCAPFDSYSEKLEALGAKYRNIKLSQNSISIIKEVISLISIKNILKEVNPSYLLTFTPKGNIYPALVKPKKTKQVTNISGLGEGFDKDSLLSKVLQLLFKVSLSKSEKILFQNQEDMNSFIKKSIVSPRNSIRINGSGVDIARFHPAKGKKFSDTKMCFLTVGRVIEKKGYRLILSLIQLYPNILNMAEFHIVGIVDKNRPKSIELYKELQAAADRGSIKLHDPVDDIEKIISQAHCMLLPSTYNEGVPRSLLEGLACGMPVITTDWKGCRDTVSEGQNGYLVKPGSVDDLYEKITKMCHLSDKEYAQFSNKSRRLALEKFDENEIVSTYMNIILNAPI
ncbi:glycosyltransferase family 4 protein [Chitinispirillales bacterium ANBcel5]|uniref:glycosyltransferase family 4 protein n=1 Tax=Cellulosispirillum alkaliphilum TaxID=3039283 RepID=UPI002A58CF68|nr:glycosyltransferase family 4 protein [Chitinispirillales bacterium ANBcel5]